MPWRIWLFKEKKKIPSLVIDLEATRQSSNNLPNRPKFAEEVKKLFRRYVIAKEMKSMICSQLVDDCVSQ